MCYKSELTLLQTEKAIKLIKDHFENKLSQKLDLTRVSAPIFLKKNSGLNDDLAGTINPVVFSSKYLDYKVEIVQSLAKWKRWALKNYELDGEDGIYTDMNAIRKDEELDNIHSIYVDQWDWEKVILKEHRNIDFLKKTVNDIYDCLLDTEKVVCDKFKITPFLTNEVFFITSEDLRNMYPTLDGKAREEKITKLHKTVFVIGIGWPLSDGVAHDSRASDYDDWNLNGDLLIYSDVLSKAVEVSSMGIRVDEFSIVKQNLALNKKDKSQYYKDIVNNLLPLSIGGGLGQSRICMLLLHKMHIGEVQASLWNEEISDSCFKNNIKLL